MRDVLVTVDFDKVGPGTEGPAEVDICSLIKNIPGAEVVNGDPTISVRVRIADREHKRLMDAVRPFCVVDEYSELDLF